MQLLLTAAGHDGPDVCEKVLLLTSWMISCHIVIFALASHILECVTVSIYNTCMS